MAPNADIAEKDHLWMALFYIPIIDILVASLTARDAARYMEAYRSAIEAIGRRELAESIFEAPSISVKLSALHPRFEQAQRQRVLRELTPRLLELAQFAMSNRMAMTVDTEEADRLMLTLDVFSAVLLDPSLKGWNGLGLALQTYQKRAPAVIDLLAALAQRSGQRIPVRLVKGAYWDSEVKHAQVEGVEVHMGVTGRDRRVEITGPVSRKMVINALNSGAKTYMADFEDSHAPTWEGTIEGQINLIDAVDGTISFVSPEGKSYRLAEKTATLIVRPRGWHLVEKHVLVDGAPVSASLFDFVRRLDAVKDFLGLE